MITIGVFGRTGRMGSLVADEISKRTDCTLCTDYGRDAASTLKHSDVVIDFTTAAATPLLLAEAIAQNKPYVCCTTGLDMAAIEAAAKHIPVLYTANTSLSLMVFKMAVAQMAKQLAGQGYDVSVHDEHHRHKADAPSGTALALGAVVGQGVTYSSIRAGNIVGDHTVTFAGTDEVIKLHHTVTDRRVFARGAIRAALWLDGRPKGLYSLEDTLHL